MFRCTLFTTTLWCLSSLIASAADPGAVMVVASDHRTAASLPPLPTSARLVVLIQDHDEPEQAVHARALAMRHATHFVYVGGQESLLSAMYRERLTTHGTIAIDLRKHLSHRLSLPATEATQSMDSLIATLFINP